MKKINSINRHAAKPRKETCLHLQFAVATMADRLTCLRLATVTLLALFIRGPMRGMP